MAKSFSIVDVLGAVKPASELPMIRTVDVGAMFIGESEQPYRRLVRRGLASVVGFEPIESQCAKLNTLARAREKFLPYFIGDGREREFYLTNTLMTSSLYEPNTALLRRFQNLDNLTRVIQTSRVQTKRLDDLPEIEGIDYLKADVQGAELDVLRGAERLLGEMLVLHIEVEFLEMYKGQPLFGDVDVFLRSHGFAFHGFLGLMGRCFGPMRVHNDPNRWMNQQIWSDVLYVRDFMRWGGLEPASLLKIAAVLHECYGSQDLAALALQHYDAKMGTKLWDQYMKRAAGNVPAAVPLE